MEHPNIDTLNTYTTRFPIYADLKIPSTLEADKLENSITDVIEVIGAKPALYLLLVIAFIMCHTKRLLKYSPWILLCVVLTYLIGLR